MGPDIFVAAALSLWPFGHKPQTETTRYVIPAWHVDATRDRFTQKMVCRVYQGDRRNPVASYQRATLEFRFRHSIDTTRADFSIDNGPARPWTSAYPALIGSGATLTGKSMTNPTGGFVILPIALFEDATLITIRPTPTSRPKVFSVGGLRDAFRSAKRLGCDADYGFAR